MAITTVQQILANPSLVPWIEERALAYAKQAFTMQSRVTVMTDLQGWVERKVSQNKRPGNARLLDEGVEIPSSQIARKRLASISPEEWGDRYPVTDRRMETDPEPVLADIVEALGYSMGRKREQKLMAVATGSAVPRSLTISGNYTLDVATQLQVWFEAQAYAGQLYHVIHPYQEQSVKLELLKLTNTGVQEFQNQFIRQWRFGGFGGLNISVSGMVPRKVLSRIVFGGSPVAGEVFRLRFGLVDTADIVVGAAAANTGANILAALNALGLGTFTGTFSNYNNMRIQSPVYVDEESQLQPGLNSSGDPVNNVTGSFIIQEVSAVARAPFFQPSAFILDVRKPLSIYQEWKPAFRTLDIGGTEVYGVGAWNVDRSAYIETNATSPLAVATP